HSLIAISILLTTSCRQQNFNSSSAVKAIDSIFFHSDKSHRQNGEYEKLIEINFDLIKRSEQIKYDKGINRSYMSIANLLWNLKKNDEAMELLNRIKPGIEKAGRPIEVAR